MLLVGLCATWYPLPSHMLQLGELTRLESLHIVSLRAKSAHFEVLRQLPRLRQLVLEEYTELPLCLAQLPALRTLVLAAPHRPSRHADEEEAEAEEELEDSDLEDGAVVWENDRVLETKELGAALADATQLEHLVLRGLGIVRLPEQLADLRLLRFCWIVCRDCPDWPAQDWALRDGPWLDSLQDAVLDARIILASRQALAAAVQLRRLAANGWASMALQQQRVLAAWANQHTPLQLWRWLLSGAARSMPQLQSRSGGPA